MTAITTPAQPGGATGLNEILASAISDRAFRLYAALALSEAGTWLGFDQATRAAGLTSHAARPALTELCRAGMVVKRLEWPTENGRRIKRTCIKLTGDQS